MVDNNLHNNIELDFPFVSRDVLCDPCELPYFVCFMFFMLVCVAFCILPIFLSTEQVDSLLKPY